MGLNTCICKSYITNFSIGAPAWAQNAAAVAAYEDDNDFIYRINDDMGMDTKNWTRHFIGFGLYSDCLC